MSPILQTPCSAVGLLTVITDKTYPYNSSIFRHATVNHLLLPGCYRGRRQSMLNISVANLVIQHLHHSTSWMTRSVRQLSKWVTEWDFSLTNKFSTDSRRHLLVQRKETSLLILQSFDRLAAFHLELLQAVLFIAELSAPVFLATCCKYSSRGLSTAPFPDIAPSMMFTANRYA
jgi:hypothetical protein